MAETRKAHKRRVKEGFYRKYINGQGIDIGCGRIDTHDGADTISLTDCIHHDKDMCDATTMETFQDNQFDYVYASHVLEHLDNPVTAIQNWERICRPGGWIIHNNGEFSIEVIFQKEQHDESTLEDLFTGPEAEQG